MTKPARIVVVASVFMSLLVVGTATGTYGHVAFVERVEYVGTEARIWVSEMNRDGLANDDTVEHNNYAHQQGWRYILVP